MVSSGAPRRAALAAAALLLAGCQRGCLASWLDASGLFGPPASPERSEQAFSLAGVDCPDGLARCEGGVVEVSRAAHIPASCQGTKGECACPWAAIATCPRGCAAEELDLIAEPDLASRQLCRPDPAEAPFRKVPGPVEPLPPGCEDDVTYFCRAGLVVACPEGAPPKAVAACATECAAEGLSLDSWVDDEVAGAVLCRRRSPPAPLSGGP